MSQTARAQDEKEQALELDDFRLSAPPALALLGIASSSVTRPNTPRALIASLVSASGSSGLVPNGFALETSPYWLLRHPALELDDYYKASPADRLLYFTAFSVATSRPAAGADTVPRDARVAIAARTLLFNGRPSRALTATSDSMRALQLAYITRYRRLESAKARSAGLAAQHRKLDRNEQLLSTLLTKVLVGPERELRDSTLRVLARRDSARAAVAAGEAAEEDAAGLEKEVENAEKRLARLAENFAESDAEPDGFTLELAAGVRSLFTQGEWDRERSDGIGIWITPLYRVSAAHFEVMGIARYLSRVADYGDNEVFDAGARAGWGIGRGTLSAEWARRSVPDDDSRSSSRWAALFDYKLPAKLSLVASFGSDFRRADGKRPVIATLGLNLGIGAVMLVPSSRQTSER
jgi:hypothetical protein